jgi:ABC-type transporter Mla subunit MlaD
MGARKKATPRTGRSTPRVTKEAAAPASFDLMSVVVMLTEHVAALRREVGAQSEAFARARLEEIPRAEDFQPLADHLYAFAETAPALLASLEAVRQAVGRVEAVAHSLAEAADTLTATHQSWSDSLMRLPRAEDYEPLVGPLREFARVSPVLAETLASVVRTVTPLPSIAERLLDTLQAGREGRQEPGAAVDTRASLEGTIERMGAVRGVLLEALTSLPRDRSYAAAATHLRELATVSPSLMAWLEQLPPLTMPLAESIAGLEQAVRELEDAERAARGTLEATRDRRGAHSRAARGR